MGMTASQLRAEHEYRHPDSYFFSRKTMQFFGDTMANFGVASQPVPIPTLSGGTVTCWQLYRRRPVKHNLRDPFYFDCETFERVHRPIATPTAI